MAQAPPHLAYAIPTREHRSGRLRVCTYAAALPPMGFVLCIHAMYLLQRVELGHWPNPGDRHVVGSTGLEILSLVSLLGTFVSIIAHPVFALVLTVSELIDRRPRHALLAFATLAVWPAAYAIMQWDPVGAWIWLMD